MSKEAEDLIKLIEGYKDKSNIQFIIFVGHGGYEVAIAHQCVDAYLHKDFWRVIEHTNCDTFVDALDWFEDNR